MDLATWISIAAVCCLGAISPGPSLAVVLRHTVGNSPRHGVSAAIAHAAGVAFWALLTIQGLALVLTRSPLLFQGLTWAGAAYLGWLGYKALTHKGGDAFDMGRSVRVSYWKAAQDGLMISLLNPKLAIFFIALFSQFVSEDMETASQLIMMATAAIIDGVWYCMIALLLSHSSVLGHLQRKSLLIDRISGGVLLLLAVRVVTL